MNLTVYEWRKLFRLPALWAFLALCLAFNGLLIASLSPYDRSFFNETSAAAEALGAVDGRTAFQAALAGDETALSVCRQYVEYLAGGTTSLINILRPEAVAIGGGVAAAPEQLLLEPLRRIVEQEAYARHGGRVTRVVRAELGNDAGIIGAAFLEKVL